MKKSLFLRILVCAALCFVAGNVFAQQPSAKASAQLGDVSGVISGNDWATIFTQSIKTNSGGDLFMDVSLECGITTNTAVMSRTLQRAVATAEANVEVRIIVDGNVDNPAAPGPVTFASRKQTLVAEFAGDFSDCMSLVFGDDGLPTGAVVVDDLCTQPEFLELILSTLNANSFNFVTADLAAGTHKIEVQAKLTYTGDAGAAIPIPRPVLTDNPDTWDSGSSYAWLGKGSVVIEKVRMIRNEDILLE